VRAVPERPYIERREGQQLLNFDFFVENTGGRKLRLNYIRVSVHDAAGQLVLQRFADENGRPGGIETLPVRELQEKALISVFNPFYVFGADVPLGTLRYEFGFDPPDEGKNRLRQEHAVTATVEVHPEVYEGKTELMLPLGNARTLVQDGHDFYAHHRRQDLSDPGLRKLGVMNNPVLFAYDLCTLGPNNELYKGSPYKNENWYTYSARIFAPGDGVVASVANAIPDNTYEGKTMVSPKLPEDADPVGLGNHVIIDHGNGEFSALVHMKPGSVRVKKGDRVRRGDLIGQVGMSGDAGIPHLHYMVLSHTELLKARALPSYFVNFERILGGKVVRVRRGQIDSGDIVQAADEK
jgi:hypothetical protein